MSTYASAEFSTEPAYIWQDDAACLYKDPVLFEIIDDEHPAGKDLNRQQKILQTVKNFAEAKTICDSCPVLKQCGENASGDDLAFTFRAGRRPRSFSGKTSGRAPGPRLERPRDAKGRLLRDGFCDRGHEMEEGARICNTCRNAATRSIRALKKSLGLDPRAAWPEGYKQSKSVVE